jgi:hypothetical protein
MTARGNAAPSPRFKVSIVHKPRNRFVNFGKFASNSESDLELMFRWLNNYRRN